MPSRLLSQDKKKILEEIERTQIIMHAANK